MWLCNYNIFTWLSLYIEDLNPDRCPDNLDTEAWVLVRVSVTFELVFDNGQGRKNLIVWQTTMC